MLKSIKCLQTDQGELQGIPRRPKVVQGLPKETQKEAKVGPRKEKRIEGHPKEAKKSQNYIHANQIYANCRSTAIQRTASNIIIFVHIIISNIINIASCIPHGGPRTAAAGGARLPPQGASAGGFTPEGKQATIRCQMSSKPEYVESLVTDTRY